MSKKGNMYEKIRTMDHLLGTLNTTISEERRLVDSLKSTSAMFHEMYESASRAYSSNNRRGSITSDDFRVISDNIISINDTLIDIKDLLEDSDTQSRHNAANPLSPGSGRQGSGSGGSGSDSDKISKYVNIAGRIFSALGLSKIFGKLGESVDKTIDAAYNIQQIAGFGESGAFDVKAILNSTYKGSSIYSTSEEYDRLSKIATSTGYDGEDLWLKYTKAIAVGVESMALDTSDLSKLLYTIEKRGTFTSAQLEGVIDTLYKYSAAGEDVTPEELQGVLLYSLDTLLYSPGAMKLSEEDILREIDEYLSVGAGYLEQGFDESQISQLATLLNKITTGTGSEWDALLANGGNPDKIRSMVLSGDASGALAELGREISTSQLRINPETDITGWSAELLEALGLDSSFKNRALWRGQDDTVSQLLTEKATTLPSAEEAAEYYTRSVSDVTTTWLGNFFAPVVDFFAKIGVGGTELGIAGGLLGGIFGPKILSKGKDLLSKVFGSGDAANVRTNATDDVTRASTSAADDAAMAAASSTDDVARAAMSSADDVARAALGSVDEVSRTATSTLGTVAKGAGKALGTIGIVLEAGLTAFDAIDAYKEGDTREGASEIGEGVGAIAGGAGGAWAGAAAGAAIGSIFPVIGNIVGGLIGGLVGGIGGSLGGGALGRGAGGAIHDATTNLKEFSSDQLVQIEDYYNTVKKLYNDYGNNAAQEYTLDTVVPYLRSIGVSASITDKYESDTGKPDFMKDFEKDKFLGYYAQGTPFLPSDGLIYAHEGEAIIPAQYNPVNNISTMRSISESMVSKEDVSDIYDMLVEIKMVMVDFFSIVQLRYTDEDIKSSISESKAKVLGTFSGKTIFDFL